MMWQMEYEAWVRSVPEAIKKDAVWKLKVYRLALFAADRVGKMCHSWCETEGQSDLLNSCIGHWVP